MLKFIEVTAWNGEPRLVNISSISYIDKCTIYLHSCVEYEQMSIDTKHSYEELKSMLKKAGAEVY